MKFSLKTLLIAFSILAIFTPVAIYFVRVGSQPEVCVSRLFERHSGAFQHYRKDDPAAEPLPYVNCISVHDAAWGRPRIIVMHRVTQSHYRQDGRFPSWLDDSFPIRVNGKKIWATDDVIVVHARNGDKPMINLLDISDVPLTEPSWPDTNRLWDLVTSLTAENAG